MATAKAITVPFSMRHIEDAERIVFEGKRAIRYVDRIGYAVGVIEVRPTENKPGWCDIHVQCGPRYNTSDAKGFTVSVERPGFRSKFEELRNEVIREMNDVPGPNRKKPN